MVRILAFHAGGPGSIPGVGKLFWQIYSEQTFKPFSGVSDLNPMFSNWYTTFLANRKNPLFVQWRPLWWSTKSNGQ